MSEKHATSGARDRLVTIQQLTESVGGTRYPVDRWDDLVNVWANKYDISARERFSFQSNQESAPYDTRWTIPWMESMDPDSVNVPKFRRLVVQNRVHDIVAARELGRRQAIELQTLAGGPPEAT